MEQNTTKLNINWFPGHMAKAIREMEEKANLVDMIIELVDARAPFASINPAVQKLIGHKYYLKVFTKIDLAEEEQSKKWKEYYQRQQIETAFVNLQKKDSFNQVVFRIKEVTKPMALKDLKRGLKPRAVRVMVVGIPNVGKSTFINTLAKRKSAGVGNIPGFTKAQKWVHGDGFELLDTPGILWPNLSENQSGVKLALIGCIRQDILPILQLLQEGMTMIASKKPQLLEEKYGICYDQLDHFLPLLAQKRGHLLKDGVLDIERTAMMILQDIKNGYIGRITLERVEDIYG